MRNLLQLLWRYHFVLLFLVIEFVSFFILVQNNSFHKANFLGSANELSGDLFQRVNQVQDFVLLSEVNKKLAFENAELKSKLQSSYHSLTPNVVYFNDSAHLLQYEYIAAKVVNNTTHKRNNYLTIDQGKYNDVLPDMGVISADGVIGIVKNSSTNYSSIISLLHKETKLSAKLKNNNYFGVLSWDGRNSNRAQLNDIPAHVKVKIGDTIVTRGGGAIFPADILIGTIYEFNEIEGTDFMEIELNLSVDFKSVSYVYVVRNKLRIEQVELESLNEIEE